MRQDVKNLLNRCGVEIWDTDSAPETIFRRDDPDQKIMSFDPCHDVISVPYIEGRITSYADVISRCWQDGPDVVIYTAEGCTIRVLDTDLKLLTAEPEHHFHIVKPGEAHGVIWV